MLCYSLVRRVLCLVHSSIAVTRRDKGMVIITVGNILAVRIYLSVSSFTLHPLAEGTQMSSIVYILIL